MNLDELRILLATIKTNAENAVKQAPTLDAVRTEETRINKGPLADALKSIKQFPPDQRGPAGKAINQTKNEIKRIFAEAQDRLRDADVAGERRRSAGFDPTLPPPITQHGSLHPVTIVQREVERLFRGLGFAVVGGPEMESELLDQQRPSRRRPQVDQAIPTRSARKQRLQGRPCGVDDNGPQPASAGLS